MALDLNPAADPRGAAVLLHPHPDHGGNRFHPFVDGLFTRLPSAGVTAVRFDFSSSIACIATKQALAALDAASRGTAVPVVLAGYSFGAGVAASIDDGRARGWYLLAPPVLGLAGAVIGGDPRPKKIVVPEHDQFSPSALVEQAVSGWRAASLTIARGVDHFLGPVDPVVDDALHWISASLGPGPGHP